MPITVTEVHVPELVIEVLRKENGAGMGQLSGVHELMGSVSEPHKKIHTNQQKCLDTEAEMGYD